MIFASKEYAEKVWTNLERQNAQARALRDKGAEYILPVRFDSTEIPGLLPTIGYLEYKREGPSGISSALLAKLGMSTASSPTRVNTLSCSLSPRALINARDGRLVVPRIESCTWGEQVSIEVRDSENDAFFGQLREQRPEVVIAYGFDVARAKPIKATRQVISGNVTWHLAFALSQTDFNSPMEMGSGDTSADQFAKLRVERLLLNKHVHNFDENAPTVRQLNDMTQELLIRGLNRSSHVERSRLPELFAALKSDPLEFLQIAWIVTVADLKLSSSVEVIEKLTLTLDDTKLHVQFAGRRHRKYMNVEPYEIRVDGELQLAA